MYIRSIEMRELPERAGATAISAAIPGSWRRPAREMAFYRRVRVELGSAAFCTVRLTAVRPRSIW